MSDFFSSALVLFLILFAIEVFPDWFAYLRCSYARKHGKPCKRFYCRNKCDCYKLPSDATELAFLKAKEHRPRHGVQ